MKIREAPYNLLYVYRTPFTVIPVVVLTGAPVHCSIMYDVCTVVLYYYYYYYYSKIYAGMWIVV